MKGEILMYNNDDIFTIENVKDLEEILYDIQPDKTEDLSEIEIKAYERGTETVMGCLKAYFPNYDEN